MADQTPDAMMNVGVEVLPGDLDRAIRQILSMGQKIKPVSIPVSLVGGAGGDAQLALQQLYRKLEKDAKRSLKLHVDLGGTAAEAGKESSMVVKHMVDVLAKDPAWSGLKPQMEAVGASVASHVIAGFEKKLASGQLAAAVQRKSEYKSSLGTIHSQLRGGSAESKAIASLGEAGQRRHEAAKLIGDPEATRRLAGEQVEILRKYARDVEKLAASSGMSRGDAARHAQTSVYRLGRQSGVSMPDIRAAAAEMSEKRSSIASSREEAHRKWVNSDKRAADAAMEREDRQFSTSGINKVKKKFEHLYGDALFQASDKAIDDFLEKAEKRFGKGTAGYNEAVGRMQKKFGPIVESRRQIGEATTDRIAQQTLESLGGPAGTSVSSYHIEEGLQKALAERQADKLRLEKQIAKGDTSLSTKSQAYKARQDIFQIEANLEKLKKLDREEEALFARMEKRGSKKSGGQMGTIEARELEKIRAARTELYGGGGVRGKTSAHGAQFAAMNAAYGFQDFFQVLAQPGMGVGRAFLAAANNIGPALGAIPGAGIKATVAVGGLMAGMSALNMVMGKGDKKAQELARSLRLLAQSYTDTESARRSVRIGTAPVGSDMGGSGYEESFKNMGFGASGRSSHREITKFFADTELARVKNITHSGESKGFAGKAWDNLFRPSGKGMAAGFYKSFAESLHNLTNVKGYSPDMSMEGGVFAKPLSRHEIRQKYGLSGGMVGGQKERFAYDVGTTAKEEYDKFWGEGGPGKTMLERKKKAKASLDASSAFASENKDPVSKLIGGIKSAISDEANLGISFRGAARSAIDNAMRDLPGSKKQAKSHLDSAKVSLSDFEENDLRFLEFAKKQSEAISNQIAEIRALDTADADIAIMELERRKKPHDTIISVMGDEHEALKKHVQVVEEFIKKIEEVPKEIAKIPVAGGVLAETMIPGFDSSGFSEADKARKELASGLAEFAKIADVMPESEKEFFRMRTSVSQFGDAVASQRNRLTKIYSEMDKFQATNIGKDSAADRNFGRSQIFEAGSVFGFDVETAKQKMDAASRSSDSFSEAINRLGKQSKLTDQEVSSMQALRKAGLIEKKRAIEDADPIEKSLRAVHKYREALSGFDESMREYALRASASGGKWKEPEARLAKFEEIAAKLGVTLSFNDQFADFEKMIKALKEAADAAGVSPQRKKEIESQLDFMGAEMKWNNPAEVARREAMGGRTSMFGDVSNRAMNLSDSLKLISDRFEHLKGAIGTDRDAVGQSKKKAIHSELEQFAASVAGFSLSTEEELKRFDLAIKELVDQMQKAGLDTKEVQAAAARRRQEMQWNNPAEVARRANFGGRESRMGAGSSTAAAENFADQLNLTGKEFAQYLNTTRLDADGKFAADEKHAKDVSRLIADFAESLGIAPTFKEKIAAFDSSLAELVKTMQKGGKYTKAEIDRIQQLGDRQRRQMQRESDSAKAERGALGGRPDEYRYGSMRGGMLNFFDRIRGLQMDLASELDNPNLSKTDEANVRTAHERRVQSEIAGLGLGGSGRTQMIDSGSLWEKIQGSLGGNEMLDAERRQVEILTRIHEALVGGKTPAGTAGRMYGSFMGGVDQNAVGHDSGGYAGGGKKPSARDTIPAMLRAGEVVLTPEHQARIAQRLKMSPADLFGGMGMTHKGSSLKAYANVGGFEDGGIAGSIEDLIEQKKYPQKTGGSGGRVALKMLEDAMKSSKKYRTGSPVDSLSGDPLFGGTGSQKRMVEIREAQQKEFDKWKKKQAAMRSYSGRQFKRYEDEEPFRERYSGYKLQSGRMGMSGFYRNQGVPLYGRGAGGQGGRTLSGPRVPTNDEAWPGGFPVISAPGTSIPGFARSERFLGSFQEMSRRKDESDEVAWYRQKSRNTGLSKFERGVAADRADSSQLASMQRRGMSSRSVGVMVNVQSGSAERAAESRRMQAESVQRKAEESVRKGEFQEKAKAAEQERMNRKAAAQKEAAEKAQRAKDDYKKQIEDAKAAVKSGKGFVGGGEDPDEKAARLEAGRERLRKKVEEKWAPKEEPIPFSSHKAGESRERNRKETLGERLVRENEERFSKFEKENPSRGGSGSSAGMTPGEKALQDQKDRLNQWKGGLGDRMEGSFPVSPGELGDTPPQGSRSVRGGDRLGRWRSGFEDDRKMRAEGDRLQVDAYKTHFDELPQKLMQNVSGKEQAASGVGFSGNDRNTAVLERIATILEGTDRNSTKHSEKVLDAIESSGISIQ